MATKLDKDVTRESSVVIDKRNILVSITSEQTIKLKPKGLRGNNGVVEIPIQKIWELLTGTGESKKKETPKKQKVDGDSLMISLHDLRSQSAISGLPTNDIAKFDSIIKNLIDDWHS